jgi:hypothetical protein
MGLVFKYYNPPVFYSNKTAGSCIRGKTVVVSS